MKKATGSVPSSGKTNWGVMPVEVGRKNGALGNGFAGSAGLLRSLTKSRCNVACHLAGGTSESVRIWGWRGVVLLSSFPSVTACVLPDSAFSLSSSSSTPPPGSSKLIGNFGSGLRRGAVTDGSKRNLLAHTCMLFPAWDVNKKADVGEKHRLRAGLPKLHESMQRPAGRSNMRRPPPRRAAASQRPSGVKAKSTTGALQTNDLTMAFPWRSTTCKAPSSNATATRAP
mmetsp:Transcript_13711/g.37491  ORF Transcript_13711/g.37491 Transcript_13711/m.37491 type:complete len:228 (+) Transcript_13711:441-1124(+)